MIRRDDAKRRAVPAGQGLNADDLTGGEVGFRLILGMKFTIPQCLIQFLGGRVTGCQALCRTRVRRI